MIYFVQFPSGAIKIGTTTNLEQRLNSLRVHYGVEPSLLHLMPGGPTEERKIHEQFSSLRLGRTEQFQPGPDLMEFIGKPILIGANPEAVEAHQKKPNPTKQVRVAQDVAELAVIVAAYRRVESSDLLTTILRPILSEMHADEIRKANSQPPAPKRPKG